MSVKTATSAANTAFVEAIESSFRKLYGDPLNEQSTAALSDLLNIPFPGTKHEYWKYTRLGKLTRNAFTFQRVENVNPAISAISDSGVVKLVFINGIFAPALSDALPDGITMEISHSQTAFPEKFNALAQPKKHVLETLSTAFCPQTVLLRVAPNTSVAPLVHLAHWSTGERSISQPRLLLDAGKGSKAAFAQTFEGDTAGFTNAVSEIFVAQNAHLDFYKIENEAESRFHHSADYVKVADGGHFSVVTAPKNNGWIRNNLNIKLSGRNAFARLNGLCSINGNQHIDNNSFVDHAVPDCNSSELYKYILHDKGTGVFNGKVIVRPDAQKTNAFQQNNNLLLSEDAQIYSKPELEIYADDVKCSHGSTTGQMDEEALFYLQSRAIGKNEAQKMLLGAFAGEVLDQIENEAVKKHLFKIFDL